MAVHAAVYRPRNVEQVIYRWRWRHSGFNVFCGNRVSPDDRAAMENLARYIILASFPQERMRNTLQGTTRSHLPF